MSSPAAASILPSTTYRFARHPKAEIARAIRRTIEERSDNPRRSWKALCESAGVDRCSSLTAQQFGFALKYFGTGIQLEECDCRIVLGDAPIDFERFSAFLAAG